MRNGLPPSSSIRSASFSRLRAISEFRGRASMAAGMHRRRGWSGLDSDHSSPPGGPAQTCCHPGRSADRHGTSALRLAAPQRRSRAASDRPAGPATGATRQTLDRRQVAPGGGYPGGAGGRPVPRRGLPQRRANRFWRWPKISASSPSGAGAKQSKRSRVSASSIAERDCRDADDRALALSRTSEGCRRA